MRTPRRVLGHYDLRFFDVPPIDAAPVTVVKRVLRKRNIKQPMEVKFAVQGRTFGAAWTPGILRPEARSETTCIFPQIRSGSKSSYDHPQYDTRLSSVSEFKVAEYIFFSFINVSASTKPYEKSQTMRKL